MPRKRRYDAAFVPAQQSWWQSLLAWLFPPRRETPYSKPAQSVHGRTYWNDTPPAVWQFRERASEARMLLRRYVEGKPTSRRSCVQAGFTQTSWQRARRLVIAAKVVDRDGELLYSGRDAQLRLDVYLDRMEAKVQAESRFIAP